MEGSTDGAFDVYGKQTQVSEDYLANIARALDASLDPRTTAPVRQQALEYLEAVKTTPDGPQVGFSLAFRIDWQAGDHVRYYGLQILEYAMRYRWSEYFASQQEQLKTWVKSLAGTVRSRDALFIRNKVAQLWVELAKRTWGEGGGWMDMDSQLIELWERDVQVKGVVSKLFALYVLEMLNEDIMNGEDAVAGLRMEVLGASLNEVMISEGLYEQHATTRGGRQEVRAPGPGWLARICAFFADCVKQLRVSGQAELSMCAVKALNTLRSTMPWISLKAAQEVNCVDCLFLPFLIDDVALQQAATETLYALLARPYSPHSSEVWLDLQQQALRPDRVALLRQAYERAGDDALDDAKYGVQKKLAEILSLLADGVAHHPELLQGNKLDVPAFFDLLNLVLRSRSLVVSIPIMHSWSRMMVVQEGIIIDMILQSLATLLLTCSERLLRYEVLPSADTDFESGSEDIDEILRYLDEDFDTTPERHAFLGNYRRYCNTIIQTITRMRPREALEHVLQQMRAMLVEGPYTRARGSRGAEGYEKNSPAALKFDAQYTVVNSALKGFGAWCQDISSLSQENPLWTKAENDWTACSEALKDWSYGIISLPVVDDPEVAGMVLQTLVLILRTVVKPGVPGGRDFVLQLVQHLLTMQVPDEPASQTFSDAVRVFEALRVLELQKLALSFADELLDVYTDLEPLVGALAQRYVEDVKLVWGYKAFLFMIIHRASGIEESVRMARLQQIMKPIYEAWQEPGLANSVSSLQHFCESLGLGNLPEFYKQYRFADVEDWSNQQLDEAGQARQARIKENNERLPLRMTKSLLAATTEKLKAGTPEFETACALWGPMIPVVLPSLLQMLRHAQAFNNMAANWSQLPEELQMVVRRTLQDRFWQSGISNESKDEFYARISGSKASYEGFASVVRGTMRNVREQGYHMLYLMTKFDEQFYGVPDLAEPLAETLFGDAEHLSANHLHPIINLATGLVTRCPPQRRAIFLPPVLRLLFTKLDLKISAEWNSIAAATERDGGEDELGDEMRMESVLRQLTFSMVSFVEFLLEYDRYHPASQQHQLNGGAANGSAPDEPARPNLSELVLSDPSVLEPLILFCTHALRMRDTRCCTTICKVFRSLVPLFQGQAAPAPQVREFLCTEVLKACITSLNEPYFADMQKELAALIAQIVLLYARLTTTPFEVMLSLPKMPAEKVQKAFGRIGKVGSERQQRAIVLELLEGVRGVSIHEAGKIGTRDAPVKGKARNGVQQQYMEVEQGPAVRDGDEAGLEDVAGLFGDA